MGDQVEHELPRVAVNRIETDAVGARVVAAIYAIGAGLGAISMLLPHPAQGAAYVWVIVALAALASVAFLLASERVPSWGLHAALAGASLMINAAILASGIAAGLYGLMFFWVAIFSAYYFSPKVVAAHLAWMLGCYALTLSQIDPSAGYSEITRWILTAIALIVAAAMTAWLAATRDELASQAHADPLTGVPNRRWLRVELEREIARAERQRFSLCAALVDIDNFKAFNDTRGHAEGDALLVDAAEVWRHVLRPSDFLARLGGDEFVVLLPDIELEHAELVLDRLRVATPRGQTASVGIVNWSPGEDSDAILAQADRLLYAAKAAGRNRVHAGSARQQGAARAAESAVS